MENPNEYETNDEKTLRDIDISMFPTQYQNVPSLFPSTNEGPIKLHDGDDMHLFTPQPPAFFDGLPSNNVAAPINFNGMLFLLN